ncbi:hypothetical protein CcCBS67573_g04419 [Chytriomyces confervae]|uniref:Translocon-associated protein subunit alpha n=1 Tax=Chytriomyces confervae TaxID=246404 RepID=A0A507FEZ5_9FUNG|nr:hypothetical protein CcCBS67573_g04419 [Chytriomyces confervae]
MNKLFQSLLALVTLFAVVFAQRERFEKDDFLVSMNKEIARNGGAQRTTEYLSFDVVFPKGKDADNRKFVSGEPSEVVVGVTNKAKQATGVYAIGGYFAYSSNTSKPIHEVLSLFLLNSTPIPISIRASLQQTRFNIRLEPKQQASLPLRFNPEMEAQDLILVVNVDYFDNDEAPHRVVAFEGPVQIIPADFIFDLSGLSVLAVFGAFVFYGGKYLISVYFPTAAASTGSATSSGVTSTASAAKKVKLTSAELKAEAAKKKEELDDEWIPEHLKKTVKKK